MNLLVILGLSAVVTPLPFLDTSYMDVVFMTAAPISLLLLSLVWTRNELSKKEGILLMLIYLGYLTYLILLEMSR